MSTLSADQLVEGFYKRNKAYSFLKDLWELPNKVLIYKVVFLLFFEEGYYDDVCKRRYPEQLIKDFSNKHQLAKEVRAFYQLERTDPALAQKILPKIVEKLKDLLEEEAKTYGPAT